MPNLYKGEKHIMGCNFCGVGTNLDERLDEDGNPLPHSIPINAIDEACRKHDIAYGMFQDTTKGQMVADKLLIDELDSIPYSSLSPSEKLLKFMVRNTINAKKKLHIGIGFGFSESDAHELHHRIVRNFPRRKVIVHNKDDIWSMDLVEMPMDRGYHYILTIIDLFSKYA